MKRLLLCTVLSLMTVSVFAADKKEVKTKVTHDKEHHHEGTADHEHEEGHHADHDHAKHHPDHDAKKAVGEDEHVAPKKK
jgi:Ni/Co efflux regulator RcnB